MDAGCPRQSEPMASQPCSHESFSLFGLGTCTSLPLSQSDANHFLLANGTNAASSSLGKRAAAPEIFWSLADTTGRNAPKAPPGRRREVASSSSSSTKAAKPLVVPLFTSRKAYFRSPPRISLEVSVAICRATSRTRIFAASMLHFLSLGPAAAVGFPYCAVLSLLCRDS